jgi:hypothetical protein
VGRALWAGRVVVPAGNQCLRRAGWERGNPVRGCEDIGVVAPGIARRHPGLLIGRPHGMGLVWRVISGSLSR